MDLAAFLLVGMALTFLLLVENVGRKKEQPGAE